MLPGNAVYDAFDSLQQPLAAGTSASPPQQLQPAPIHPAQGFVPQPFHHSPPSPYSIRLSSSPLCGPLFSPILDSPPLDALRSRSGEAHAHPEHLPKPSSLAMKTEEDEEYLDGEGIESGGSTSSAESKKSWGSSKGSGKSGKSTAASSAGSKASRGGKGASKGGKAPRTTKRYPCAECLKDFSTSGHLSRHKRIHRDEKKFFCPWPECTSRFNRQDNMTQHYKTHSNGTARPKPTHRPPQTSLPASSSTPLRERRKTYSAPPNDSYFPDQRGRASSLSQVMGSLFDPGAPAAEELDARSDDEFHPFERFSSKPGMEVDEREMEDGVRRSPLDETDDGAGYSSFEEWREHEDDHGLSSPSSSSFAQSPGPRSRAGSSSTNGLGSYASGYESPGSASRRGSGTYEGLLDRYEAHSSNEPLVGRGRNGSGSACGFDTLVDRVEELSTAEGRRNGGEDAQRASQTQTEQGDLQRLGFFESLPTSSRTQWAPPPPPSSLPWTTFLSDPPAPHQPSLFYHPQHQYLPLNLNLSQSPSAFQRPSFAHSTDPNFYSHSPLPTSTSFPQPDYPRPPLETPSSAPETIVYGTPSPSSFLTLAPLLFSPDRPPLLPSHEPSRETEFDEVLSAEEDAAQRSRRQKQWFRRQEQVLGGAFGEGASWDFGAGEGEKR